MEQKLNIIKRLLLTLFITELTLFQILQAELDKNALPDVEEGFQINFFVKEPHIINPSSLCFDKKGQLYVGAGPQYRHPKRIPQPIILKSSLTLITMEWLRRSRRLQRDLIVFRRWLGKVMNYGSPMLPNLQSFGIPMAMTLPTNIKLSTQA